jgi:DNA-binding NarL/FixJ family response regulator
MTHTFCAERRESLVRDMMRNTKGRRSIRPSPSRPQVVEVHRQGLPVKEIARRLGLTYPWAWRILKEAKE